MTDAGFIHCGQRRIAQALLEQRALQAATGFKAAGLNPGQAVALLLRNDFSRRREMVISGGVNIYPAEIESVLVTMPGVLDCAVIGIPDDEFGESLLALVQTGPDGEQKVTAKQIILWLRERVAGYKVPRQIEFRAELPRDDSGKIYKRRLREPYWKGRERLI